MIETMLPSRGAGLVASPRWRIQQLAIAWGSVGIVYTGCGMLLAWQGRSAHVLHPGLLDQLPRMPVAVWLYLSFFALVPWAFLHAPPQRVVWLRHAMQWAAAVCIPIFLLWPTRIATVAMDGSGLNARLLGWLQHVDSVHNCLPSLHGALTVLAVIAPWPACSGGRRILIATWGAAILVSVLLVRQHLALDLALGMILGLGAWYLAARRRPA